MKKSNLALFTAFLLFTSEFLYSDEYTPVRLERENLMFSVLLTSGGSTGCPSSRSVKIINTYSELIESFNYLYECSSQNSSEIEPPNIDLTTGSAVLLDMGVQGSLGHFITAIQVFKLKGEHHMYFATLGPEEGCWAQAQTQRPLQLIYINEKINSLNEHHVSGIEPCDDR